MHQTIQAYDACVNVMDTFPCGLNSRTSAAFEFASEDRLMNEANLPLAREVKHANLPVCEGSE